jgi:predicted DNA-binding transcriptional regulator AlpA
MPVSEHSEGALPSSVDIGDRLVRVQAVADVFGVSVRHVWNLAASGQIPAPIRIGGATRWRASEIRAFLDAASARGQGASL